ncbi:MAG: VOC family protein [Chitinophagaceae bacterium]|nr:VOC family protein [Chitinophagaceae bacterium]
MAFTHSVSWFEIPTIDINRAQAFYEQIFDMKMMSMDMPQISMRIFPAASMMHVTGALVHNKEFYKPSATTGPVIYLNANPDVQTILDRIEAAGGKILVPKTEISPEHGHMAIFLDTEGNRMALHSIPPGMTE